MARHYSTRKLGDKRANHAGACLRGDCSRIAAGGNGLRNLFPRKDRTQLSFAQDQKIIALDEGRIGLLLVFPRSQKQDLPQIRIAPAFLR